MAELSENARAYLSSLEGQEIPEEQMERLGTLVDSMRQELTSLLPIESILNCTFDSSGGPHDWQKYIPDDVEALWPSLPYEAKLSIYYIAERVASAEDWD